MVAEDKIFKIGVLALQGDFSSHIDALHKAFMFYSIKTEIYEIREAKQVLDLDLLVFPGGESSSIIKLMKEDLKNSIIQYHKNGGFIYGTCAGAILLADKVSNPQQFSFKFIEIEIERNSYGRQKSSFITNKLEVTEIGKTYLDPETSFLEGIFIRAPKIIKISGNTKILLKHQETPVLAKQDNVLVCSFHPELSPGIHPVYKIIAQEIVNNLTKNTLKY